MRGIEINIEDDGYEVRVGTHASAADYRLFAVAIQALMRLTAGKAYLENEEEAEITDVAKTFDDAWIAEQQLSCLDATRALTRDTGHPVVMDGLYLKICLGAQMYKHFDIPLRGIYPKERLDELLDYLCSVQWYFAGKEGTGTKLRISGGPADKEELSISGICIYNGEIEPFDFVEEASLLGLIDMDDPNNSPVLIPFKEAWRVLPNDLYRRIDEWQYERIGELSVEKIHQIMARVKHLQPDDLYYRPTYPGEGWEEGQNTAILTWNPEESGFSVEEHNEQIPRLLTDFFHWHIQTSEKPKWGDRFYLIKVGGGERGIVMSGVFISKAYEIANGQYDAPYMDMHVNFILNPKEAPMLTTDELSKLIPSFDWEQSPSGCMLSSEEAQKMEHIWKQYLLKVEKCNDELMLNAIQVHR